MARAIRGHWPLRAAIATLVLQFALGVSYTWGALAPFALSQTHWTSLQVAIVFSSTPAGYGIGSVIGGRLADRYPPRRLLWFAFGAVAVGFAVAFLLPSPLTFAVFYGMLATGFSGGFSIAVSFSAMRQVFPGRFGAAGGALSAVFASSALVLVPVVTLMVQPRGWVAALAITASPVLALAGAALLLMPALPVPPRHAEEAHPPLFSLLPRALVWSSLLVELLATPLGSYAFAHVGRIAREDGLAIWIASAAVAGFVAGNGAGRLAAGAATDRFGTGPVMAAMLLGSIGAAVLVGAAGSAPQLLIGAFLAGMGFGAPAGIMPRVAAEAAPDAPGAAFGLIFTGYTTGALSGPLLGELLPLGGAGFLAMAVLPLLGLFVVVLRQRLRHGVRVSR